MIVGAACSGKTAISETLKRGFGIMKTAGVAGY